MEELIAGHFPKSLESLLTEKGGPVSHGPGN
jgi:hypothetical protein